MKKILFLMLISVGVFAQKKPLTHDVYDSWKSISDRAITNDGKFAGYIISPQEGDNKLIIFDLKTNQADSVQRGSDLKLSASSDFAIFKIKPSLKATKDAKRAKKKKDDMPKDSLGVYELATKTITKIPNVSSYKMPEKAGGWVAYLGESAKVTAKKDTSKNAPKTKTPKKESEENGYKLTLRQLKTKTEKTFGFVTEYEFTKNGKYLSFASTGNDSTLKSGVYVYDIEKASLSAIYEAKGKFKKLSFAEEGNQLAFVADLDTNAKTQVRQPKLFYWKAGTSTATLVADSDKNPSSKNGWLVSAEYTPRFAKDGSKLFFGTNPKPMVKDTTLLPEEVVNVDVWNYQDKRLMTQQLVTAEQDKKKSYLAVMNLSNSELVQLGNKNIPDIQIVSEGNADYVIGTNSDKYSGEHWDWTTKNDVYLISTKTGEAQQISTRITGNPQASPEGKYVYWYSKSDTAWFAYSVKSKQTIRLTNDKKFSDAAEDDHPDFPNPYGLAGWTKDDEQILVYDKYDIWAINPQEVSKPKNLTQGREKNLTFRYIRLDPEVRNIDMKQSLTLRMFDNVSKESGYAQLSGGQVNILVKDAYNFSMGITKAKDADKVLFQKSNFKECADLHTSDLSFKSIQKISDANPQQKEYNWGSVELVKYKALDGTPLEGLLYKPENFDASKKYPMITYFYEIESDNLHDYREPSPSRSSINYSYYVSNGYLIFVPNIVYKIGYPGQSAYNCIIGGVKEMLQRSYIDEKRLALQGHSWGGYQTAYLITQTNLFRAAESGAPVVNMTSAYSGIRWGTGLARQAQYEHTQSRIGGNLWEKPMLFLENSPLFYLPKVETPVLILHNDGDDAVPWYQGIEMFLGLKRLNKPTWLLNYNGERHGIMERKNRKDFSIRMSQFFDYYLKDASMPQWMKEGVPATEKSINYGLK